MRKLYISIYCLALLTQTILAQTISLKKMTDSCDVLKKSRNYDKAISLCINMLPMINKTPDNIEKGNAYQLIGNLYAKKYEYNFAEQYYTQAIDIANKCGSNDGKKLKAHTLLNQSLIYLQNGDYEMTLKICFQAENIFQEIKDIKGLAEVHNVIGGVYVKLQQEKKSQVYNLKAFQEAQQSGDSAILCNNLIGYGNYLKSIGDTIGAINTYVKALKIAEQIRDLHIISTACYDIAFINSKMENYQLALHYYKDSYYWAFKEKSLFDQYDALYKIGLTYYYLKEFKVARDTLLHVLAKAEKKNFKELRKNIYDVLNFLEAETGNFAKAYKYLGNYVDLSEENFSLEGQHQINFLETKYKAAQRESEINRLQQDNELKNLKIRSRTQLSLALIFMILLMIILFLAIYRNRQGIARKNMEIQAQKIRELEKEKILLATQSVLKGEEKERQRLARDLHDGLGGLLSGVKLKLTNIKGNYMLAEESTTQFENAIDLLDNSIKELRSVAHNMMPAALVKFGLKDALQDFCDQLSAGKELSITFNFLGEGKRFENSLEITVYRITQELANNALKHANATEILVQVVQEDNRIHLTVMDDGKGFDTSATDSFKSAGLKNIKARVESFRGNLDIYSEPGKGTEIGVEFTLS